MTMSTLPTTRGEGTPGAEADTDTSERQRLFVQDTGKKESGSVSIPGLVSYPLTSVYEEFDIYLPNICFFNLFMLLFYTKCMLVNYLFQNICYLEVLL